MRLLEASRICSLPAVAALLAACDPSRPIVPEPIPPVTLELAEEKIEVIAGLQGPGPTYQPTTRVPLTVHRNGYTGPITVTIELLGNAPFELSVVGPWQGSLPDSVGTVFITTPASVAAGTYKARIRAATDSLGARTDTLTIVVAPFIARVHQSSVVVAEGATNTVSVFYKRLGGAVVTVTATPIPGMTVNVVNGTGAAYVDVSAPSGASGTHSLTITATSGNHQRSWPVQVIVQPLGAKRTVSFRLCRNTRGSSFNEIYDTQAVAYANEGEAWTTVTPDSTGTYTISATNRVSIAERFSYALGAYAPGTANRVIHLAADELQAMQCAPTKGLKFYNVRASYAESFILTLGRFRAGRTTPTGLLTRSGGAAQGSLDLFATAAVATTSAARFRAIVRRAINVASGDSLIVDFADAESVPMDSASAGLAGVTSAPVTHVHGATTAARLTPTITGVPIDRYWALPESRLAPGEVQSVIAGTTTRGVVRYFRGVAPLSLELGPEMSTPTIDIASHMISLPRQSEYPDVAGVGQLTIVDYRGVYNYTEVWQSRGYAGTPEAFPWVFRYPDLGRFSAVAELTGDPTLIGGIAGKGSAQLFFGGVAVAGDGIVWAKRSPSRFGVFLPYPVGY